MVHETPGDPRFAVCWKAGGGANCLGRGALGTRRPRGQATSDVLDRPGDHLRARSVPGLLPRNCVLLRTVNTRERRQVSGRRLAESAVMLLHGFGRAPRSLRTPVAARLLLIPGLSLGRARAAHLENVVDEMNASLGCHSRAGMMVGSMWAVAVCTPCAPSQRQLSTGMIRLAKSHGFSLKTAWLKAAVWPPLGGRSPQPRGRRRTRLPARCWPRRHFRRR